MEFSVRFFESDAEIELIGEGLLKKTLPKSLWTHEAHFAATVYLLIRRPEIVLEKELPSIISSYNAFTGSLNTETSGYHETLTQFYIMLVRAYLSKCEKEEPLKELCNNLVCSPQAHRSYPLNFWSKEVLFSPAARKRWIEPDLKKLKFYK